MWNKVFRKERTVERSNRWLFGTMLFFGVAGLISAFTLSVEKIHILQNADAQLTCNFNLVLNCGTVMQTPQASVFGFPDSFIGLMAYPVVITLAIVGLSGVRFPRRFLQIAQIGYGLGLLFAYWLFFQSVFVIQVLCPWCLVVTFSTTLIFESLLRYNLRENTFVLSKKVYKKVAEWLSQDYDKLVVAGWVFAMVVLVLVKFRDGLFA